jgi:hypothetical protein
VGPETRSWGLTSANAPPVRAEYWVGCVDQAERGRRPGTMLADAEALCPEFFAALSPRSPGFRSVLAARESLRSLSYATNLRCYADSGLRRVPPLARPAIRSAHWSRKVRPSVSTSGLAWPFGTHRYAALRSVSVPSLNVLLSTTYRNHSGVESARPMYAMLSQFVHATPLALLHLHRGTFPSLSAPMWAVSIDAACQGIPTHRYDVHPPGGSEPRASRACVVEDHQFC